MISKNVSDRKFSAYSVFRSHATHATIIVASMAALAMNACADSSDTGNTNSKKSPYFERHERYHSVDAQTVHSLEEQFSKWLSAVGPGDTGTQAENGFARHDLGDDIQLFSDMESRGWGYFFHGPQRSSSILLQAPHQFHDLRTGEIAAALFERGVGKALAMNSAHRYSAGKGAAHTDWAHLPMSPFNAFTRAFMHAHPEAIVVQIHGYAEKKRKSPAGRLSDVIISSGQRWPHPTMLNLAACLQQNTDWQILRYPEDTGELGGTTNVQGRLMNSLGNPRFIHLELSSKLRKALVSEERALKALADCIESINPEAE